ncbi:MAG: hypothetical protein K6T71_06485 [Candidatus Bipolaricaulota bacterium]|nr:hypothetical protein [Candidatus Bipolaricaulota bacterium]
MREPTEEERRWLEQAEEDLKWARHLAREAADGAVRLAGEVVEMVRQHVPTQEEAP